MRNAAIYLVVLTTAFIGAQTASAEIAWEGKLRDAHAKAKQQGKLLLLHFYTDNCVYCDRLEAGAFRSPNVSQSINQNFIPVKVHGGKNPKLAQMFRVSKYPTDVIVTTAGKALSHSVSPQQPDRYVAMLNGAQNTYDRNRAAIAKSDVTPTAAQPTTTQTAAAHTAAVATSPTKQIAANQATQPAASVTQTSPSQPTQSYLVAPQPSPAATPGGLGQMPVKVAAENTQPSSTDLAGGNPRQNQFVLPDTAAVATKAADLPLPNAVQASLASSRSAGFALPTADLPLPQTKPQIAAEPAAANQVAKSPSLSKKPELAIEGFCPVSVVNKGEWVEGKPELGVIHLGRLYLFADNASMETFLADPIPYTPMLNEIDVVRFFEEKKIVKGNREWGVIDPVHNRMFFFQDEKAMLHFEKSFDRYLDAAIEVMDHAIQESNPGV